LLDGTSGFPKGLNDVVAGMALEKDNDATVQAMLKTSEKTMKGNALSAQAVKALGFGKRKASAAPDEHNGCDEEDVMHDRAEIGAMEELQTAIFGREC